MAVIVAGSLGLYFGIWHKNTCPYACCFDEEYAPKYCPEGFACESNACIKMSFVSVSGTDFSLDKEKYHFIGAFSFPTLTHLIYYPNWTLDKLSTNEAAIDQYLNSLVDLKIEVIRFFGFGRYEIQIQKDAGVAESENSNWDRLDYLIKACEKRGIKIVFNLWDYWDYGSSGTIPQNYEYWNDTRIKTTMEKIVSRYKDSPAIFAWELLNEGDLNFAREESTQEKMYEWVKETSEYVKSLDPKHLVSTGFSGEYLREDYFLAPKPEGVYESGRKFMIKLYGLPSLDFICFHAYGGPIDEMTDASYYNDEWKEQMTWYLEETVKIGQEIGKPILHEEWGVMKQVGEPTRSEIYRYMLDFFTENNISNFFNGWGNDEANMNIYVGDTETDIVSQSIKTWNK